LDEACHFWDIPFIKAMVGLTDPCWSL